MVRSRFHNEASAIRGVTSEAQKRDIESNVKTLVQLLNAKEVPPPSGIANVNLNLLIMSQVKLIKIDIYQVIY